MPPTATVEKASILAVKRETARRRRRRETDHVAEELNIIAMMDMMTIILVFLLKSLSASANNIPQGDDLRLPHSSVNTAPSTALQVIVSRVSVTVNGRFVVALRNGTVDPNQKRGGGTGLLINPLADTMRDQAQIARTLAQRSGTPFKGEVAIIADEHLPSRTVFEVLYTCGQSGFSDFKLLVLKGRGG